LEYISSYETKFYAVECYAMRIRIFYNYSIYKRVRSRRYSLR